MAIMYTSLENNDIFLMNFTGEPFEDTESEVLKSDIPIVSKEIKKSYTNQGKKEKILIDISQFKAEYMTEATRAFTELAKEDEELVEITAIHGGEKTLKIFGEIVIAHAGEKDIQFVGTNAEWMAWLAQP